MPRSGAHSPAALLAIAWALSTAPAGGQTPKTFEPPGRTAWTPVGCRTADPIAPPLASRAAWRSLHADEVNTDEVSIAYAPVFQSDWVAEPGTWNPTGPVFDSDGNLYFVPLLPYEDTALLSLEAATGARRWSVPNTTGAPVGSGSPLVLEDPGEPGAEIVYVGLYDRAFAVRPDGTTVWDVPTGLEGSAAGVFGLNYHPGADAIVGLAGNGSIYALDRATGASVLAAPYEMPGERSPPGPPLNSPQSVLDCAQGQLETLVDTGGLPITDIIDVLLGNGVEVANYFSITAPTGRMWVTATAPDAEDGTVDGVSELGALYALDLVPSGGMWTVSEACHRSFEGGSASTPALRRDGTRVYVGDNVGNLLAIDQDCEEVWRIPVGGQVLGSVAVAADNGEVYASTASTIVQVIDAGTSATIAWSADLDVFELETGQIVVNQNLAGVAANGIAFQAGAGLQIGAQRLTITTGMGLLDRQTGAVRWFAPGLEETVAVMSTGPDGALYIGNSPIRRLFTYCLAEAGLLTIPVAAPVGGIHKWAPRRLDLLVRDVACAASDRAANAHAHRKTCAAGLASDRVQLTQLVAQARGATEQALAGGDLTPKEKKRVDRLLGRAERKLAKEALPRGAFRAMCRMLVKSRG